MSQKPRKVSEAMRGFLDDAKSLMERQGVTQSELARRLEVSPAHVSNLFRARSNPTIATLEKLGRALGAPLSLQLAMDAESPLSDHEGTSAGSKSRTADQVLAEIQSDLTPEAFRRIVRFARGQVRPPGRPKGSGEIDDKARLHWMADLLVKGEARSERHGADLVATEDPGHSRKATARRLRGKFAKDRKRLLAAARERLRRELGGEPEEMGRDAQPASMEWAHQDGSSSSSSRTFWADLQREFGIEQRVIDQLRQPSILEEIARLSISPEVHWEEVSGLAGALFRSPVDDINSRMGREPGLMKAMRESNPLSDINSAMDAATGRYLHEDPAMRAARSGDITGLKDLTRQVDPWGEINRKFRSVMDPFWKD